LLNLFVMLSRRNMSFLFGNMDLRGLFNRLWWSLLFLLLLSLLNLLLHWRLLLSLFLTLRSFKSFRSPSSSQNLSWIDLSRSLE
jgi:hypothetical protein